MLYLFCDFFVLSNMFITNNQLVIKNVVTPTGFKPVTLRAEI